MGNARLDRGSLGSYKILFGRYALCEQALLPGEIGVGQRQARARGLDFAFKLCRFAAFDDGKDLAALDRLPQVSGQ